MRNQTLIWRHRRENLKKCTLRGLEGRFQFYTYPKEPLPPLSDTLLLTIDAPILTRKDSDKSLLLLDATWRYADVMMRQLPSPLITRSLPNHFVTAYPRKQEDCSDPTRGLASIEALYIAHHILGWDTTGLLDNYHWKDSFLQKNNWCIAS